MSAKAVPRAHAHDRTHLVAIISIIVRRTGQCLATPQRLLDPAALPERQQSRRGRLRSRRHSERVDAKQVVRRCGVQRCQWRLPLVAERAGSRLTQLDRGAQRRLKQLKQLKRGDRAWRRPRAGPRQLRRFPAEGGWARVNQDVSIIE